MARARQTAGRPGPHGQNPFPKPAPPQKISGEEIVDFFGLETNRDSGDIKPGASRVQINITAETRGTLRPRMGYVVLKFRS